MAFNITMYYNDSEKNKMSKELRTLRMYSGELKDATSIVNPVITINENISSIAKANYLYISEFQRYYFITNIRSIKTSLVEISAHVDVLMSFKDEILSNSAIVKRSENNWNLYLDDGSIRVYADSIVLTKKFPSGFTTQNYVMAIAAPDVSTSNE